MYCPVLNFFNRLNLIVSLQAGWRNLIFLECGEYFLPPRHLVYHKAGRRRRNRNSSYEYLRGRSSKQKHITKILTPIIGWKKNFSFLFLLLSRSSSLLPPLDLLTGSLKAVRGVFYAPFSFATWYHILLHSSINFIMKTSYLKMSLIILNLILLWN